MTSFRTNALEREEPFMQQSHVDQTTTALMFDQISRQLRGLTKEALHQREVSGWVVGQLQTSSEFRGMVSDDLIEVKGRLKALEENSRSEQETTPLLQLASLVQSTSEAVKSAWPILLFVTTVIAKWLGYDLSWLGGK